ncbi:MAG: glycosyltransferase family 39 protein, partial [Nocardioidaceae bacterium]
EGQLRQRLVPVLAGIGMLVVMSLLFRRLRLGWAGAFGTWLLALAPEMLSISAYTRPYMLPMFLSVLFVYTAQRWLDERQPRWLVVTVLAAVLLPLARVPEPVVFLVTTAATLAWLTFRGRFSWSQAGPLIGICVGALAVVGYPMYRSLASEAPRLYDPSLAGIIDRFGKGVHELLTAFLPMLASWFPWWPITLLVLAAALALPASRRRLCQWWFFWPLLAGPLVFAVAYHFVTTLHLDVLPYRPRQAAFFLPAFTLVVVALASTIAEVKELPQRVKMGAFVLLGAILVGQLPAAAKVLTKNIAPDFAQAADVLAQDLPDDAIVLFDNPNPIGRWRSPWVGHRFMGHDPPYTAGIPMLASDAWAIPNEGPVYLLFLDSQCGSVICDTPAQPWDRKIRGWHVESRFDRFTLYRSGAHLSGRTGVIRALRGFGTALGPRLGYPETFAAATVLKREGRGEVGRAIIEEMYAQATPDVAKDIQALAEKKRLDPFR